MVLCDTADSDAFKRSLWKLTGTYGQMHASQVRQRNRGGRDGSGDGWKCRA